MAGSAARSRPLEVAGDDFLQQNKVALRASRVLVPPMGRMGALPFGSAMSGWAQRWGGVCLSDRTSVQGMARMLEGENSYFQTIVGHRRRYYGAGFALVNGAGENDQKGTAKFSRLVKDVWMEYTLTDSAVVFWRKGGPPAVMNSEDVEYDNRFGREKVTLKLGKQRLNAQLRRSLGTKLSDALENTGKLVVEDGGDGDLFCRVLTAAKAGAGLAMPRVKAALMDLAIAEMLRLGEVNGAAARRTLFRHSKKGHEIKQGNLAGQPLHFFKSAFGKALIKTLQTMPGVGEFISNFDLSFDWVYLPAEFFDAKVYEAVDGRLAMWAGGAGLLAAVKNKQDGNFETALDSLRQEAMAERGAVGTFLTEIISEMGGAGDIGWDWSIFFSGKELKSFVSQASTNGHMSPQTAREWLHLDDKRESMRMRAAKDRKDDFTPPFEAKQGLLGDPAATTEGGRPPGGAKTE